MKYLDLMLAWLMANMDVVFFVYGLAFVYMGLAVLLQPKQDSKFKIAPLFWLLAIFGLVHGVCEWLDMWIIIKGASQNLKVLRLSCLAISYIALFEFGRRLVVSNLQEKARFLASLEITNTPEIKSNSFRPPLYLRWWMALIIGAFVVFGASLELFKVGAILLRYGFGLAGSLLTGYGLWQYCRLNKANIENLKLNKYFSLAFGAFAFYALLGGLIVPGAAFPPASIINQENFLAVMHFPVQILRALSAIFIAWSISHILNIFHLETEHVLSNALKAVQDKEEALSKTEDRYRSLFDSINDPTFVHAFNGQIFEVNNVVCEVLGYPEQELFQKKIQDLLSVEGQTKFPECLVLLRKKGFGLFETSLLSIEQKSIPMEMNCKVVEYNGVPAILSTARNIEERKKAESALFVANEMLEMKVNQRTDSLKKLNIELENSNNVQRVVSNILQIAMEPIPFKAQLDRVLSHLLALPWLASQPRGSIFVYDEIANQLQLKSHQGIAPQILEQCAVLDLGVCLCGLAASSKQIIFAEDNDEKHTMQYEDIPNHGHYCVPILSEEKLLGVLNLYVNQGHLWNQQESDFLKIVAHTIASIIERNQTELMKEQFLQTVSHELRTPLTAIIGFQDILLSGMEGPLNVEQEKLLQISMKNSESLHILINDLLDLNKLEAGEMPIQLSPVNIVTETESFLHGLSAEATKKGIAVKYVSQLPQDLKINADLGKIKTIVRNLVGNAIKFTEQGEICLGLQLQDSTLQITVSDTGIGIPESAHEHIFKKFSQVDNSSTRKADGTGLGLAIVKKTATLLGGTIGLESELGKGTTFKVEIPI